VSWRANAHTLAVVPVRAHIVLHKTSFDLRERLPLHEAGQPVRFRHLQRAVHPITQKELTKRLRALERSGLVHRRVYAEVPPRVEYRLTDLGLTLMPALTALSEWAERYGPVIDEHCRRADAGRGDQAETE
jgi:DNA-binding HxlR family transcriptional regulator